MGLVGKKKHLQNEKNFKKLYNLPFLTVFGPFFADIKKKSSEMFFFRKVEKNKTKTSQIEWVSGLQTFPRKKKYGTFDPLNQVFQNSDTKITRGDK